MSAQEKAQQIKQVQLQEGRCAGEEKERGGVRYCKGVGKRVKRPAGVKGHFKVVDPRMKDTRGKAVARGKGQQSKGQQLRRRSIDAILT